MESSPIDSAPCAVSCWASWLLGRSLTRLVSNQFIFMKSLALHLASLTALVPLSLSLAAEKEIQFPAASQHATITQRVGLTDVSMDYSRPDKRGREIFGGLVPYGKVWRTGAN